MQCNHVSYQSILKHFHFFYLENKFTTCALFQFPSYVHFTSFFGLLFQLTHTHTKNHVFSFQSLVGIIRRLLITEVPVGHFRRLIYSTPNREGPDTLVAQLTVSHLLNRLKPSKTVSQHVYKSMTRGHIFSKPFIIVNPCSSIKLVP